ncbi:MAG: hypothetical protein ACQEXJ_20280 [Myxococcota bacterium]
MIRPISMTTLSIFLFTSIVCAAPGRAVAQSALDHRPVVPLDMQRALPARGEALPVNLIPDLRLSLDASDDRTDVSDGGDAVGSVGKKRLLVTSPGVTGGDADSNTSIILGVTIVGVLVATLAAVAYAAKD